MKRLLLIGVAFAQAFSLTAQHSVKSNERIWMPNPRTVNDNNNELTNGSKPATHSNRGEKALGEKVLGVTTYDLQTNYTVQDRIAMNSAGDIAVVWTASEQVSPFNDRGTGYSFYSGPGETWTQSSSYPRIETARCGWPSILFDGDGGEHIISHSTVTGQETMRLNSRSTAGTGTWTEKVISSTHLTWNRAAIGGPDGNTIHMIATMNNPDDSSNFQNMSNALLYYRSQDAGQTWDVQDYIIPGLDSGAMGVGFVFTNDGYSIVAKGNHVAIGSFNGFNDVIIMESLDNGNTWAKTIVSDFPYKGFQDFKKTHLTDSNYIITCDGSGSIIIDEDDIVHISYARMRVTNNLTGDGFFRTYFTDSIVHFRNSTPSYKGFSAYYIDENNDSLLNFTKYSNYGWNGVLSYPNLAAGNDSLYLVWSGTSDQVSSGIDAEVNMRQIFLMRSGDGGTTWSTPTRLTITEEDFSENVFPDIYEVVDDRIRVVFHRDPYPSNYVAVQTLTPPAPAAQYWQTALSDNDVVYLEIDLGGGGIGIGIEKTLNQFGETGVYPNPTNGLTNLTVLVYQNIEVNINVTNVNGQVVHNYNGAPLKKGSNKVEMDLSHLDPGIYMINIFGGGFAMNEKVVIK